MKLAIIAATLLMSGCSSLQLILPVEGRVEKRTDDKIFYAMEAVWHAENIVDMGQTMHIASSQRTDAQLQAWTDRGFTADRYCYEEANFMTRPLIGKHPSRSEVALSSVAWSLLYRGVSEFLARKDTSNEYGERNSPWYIARWSWHLGMLGAKTWQIGHNSDIGLKPFGTGCKN